MAEKIKIAVLMGGKSPEYDVSLISGGEIINNLNKKKYTATPIIINKNGGMSWISKVRHQDVVFIAMHGPYGEDGTIQGFLETAGVKYTGSDVLASAVGMDKIMFRKVMTAEGIPIPKYTVVDGKYSVSGILKLIKGPWFIKPSAQGSSVGASIARNIIELEKSIGLASKYGNAVLIDEYITGREFTCSILGNKKPVALPVVEIRPRKSNFFDYSSKYTDSGAEEIVPAKIPHVLAGKLQNLALRIYKIVGCKGFSRVDFIVRKDGSPVVLEINTIPGLTPKSLFPKAASAAGYTYSQLLDKLINLSLRND
jgi:D-alanine-D-alanine ligase